MNELAIQKLIVDAVRRGGGFSFKLANRFLIGVPDVLIQLPVRGTSLWEVKVNDVKASGTTAVKITLHQYNFLRDYAEAGGKCGLISILRSPGELMIEAVPFGMLDSTPSVEIRYRAETKKHTVLRRGHREQLILEEIERVYDEE